MTEFSAILYHSCPCGEPHQISAAAFADIQQNGTRLKISSLDGPWLVPYDFITCHGIDSTTLPEVAARYGFERG